MLKQLLKNKVLVVLFFLFILIRLPLLDQINLLHDERDIVLSGYSIAKTGKDLFGNLLPLNFKNISPNNPLFAIYYSSFWSLLNSVRSVFYARLPFVLVSSLLIFLVYEVVYEITKDRKKSLLTTVIFCFSPWVFHITRLALDIPLSIVLLMAGILLYLKKRLIVSYLFFFLTFYTYQGFRLLIPFLLIYLEFFFYLKEKNSLLFFKKSALNIVFFGLLMISTLFIDPGVTKNRLNEIIFFNTEKTSQEVIFRRITSIAPDKVKQLIDNKLTVAFDYVITNFVKGQDIIYLFKEGDYSAINGNTASGQFFFVFLIFYYLGFVSLGKKVSKNDLYLIGFAGIGLVPSLLSTNGVTFSIRSMLSGIGFSYLIALGILFSLTILKKFKYKKLLIFCFIILFLINLIYVSYIYFFRRPVLVGEIFNENERQFASYLFTHKNSSKMIYHNSIQDLYLSVAFFDNQLPINNVQNNLIKSNRYQWNNYAFIRCNHTMDYLTMKNAIIAEGCLTPKLYEVFNDITNPKVKERIKYKDYSTKTAYFITE